jgi:hypothetical protein
MKLDNDEQFLTIFDLFHDHEFFRGKTRSPTNA